MLSHEDNELLTRVGPGTPMGTLMREYWIPALLATELPEPDGPPLRVRLLGEDLIAFRTTCGDVGLVEQGCPHRRASLFFARNEDNGLRCAYHGWKFNTRGECVDMPNELPECTFKDKVSLRAYPCRERNGVIWAYLGPRQTLPALPDFEWNQAVDNIPFLWRNYRQCNWLQALEGDIDSSHLNYLHRTLDAQERSTVPGHEAPGYAGKQAPFLSSSGAPTLEVVETEAGVMYGARRRLDRERDYWRVSPFLLPFHTMVGGGGEEQVQFNGKAWVPMDDEHTLVLEWQFRPGQPWSDDEREELMRVRNPWGFLPATSEPAGAWKPRANAGNDYFLDRGLQRTKLFCGIQSNPLQDTAMQESMGPICDRTREQLGPADAMIIQVRRRLLRAAKELRDRQTIPPGVDQPAAYRVRPAAAILPVDSDWRQVLKTKLMAS